MCVCVKGAWDGCACGVRYSVGGHSVGLWGGERERVPYLVNDLCVCISSSFFLFLLK